MFNTSGINALIELFHIQSQFEQLTFIHQVLNNSQHTKSLQLDSLSTDNLRFKDGVFYPHCGETYIINV